MHATISPHLLTLRRSKTSAIEPQLQQAYLETQYSIEGPDGFTLAIGIASQSLRELHGQHRVSCSTLITPDNPYSQAREVASNQQAMSDLIAELDKRKLRWCRGSGQGQDGSWPAEESVLVFGLGRDGASELGQRWGQNAVVWSDEDAIPKLLLLR